MDAARYIADAEQYGKSVGSTSASGINWAAAFGALSGSMKYMQATIDMYAGVNDKPRPGCMFAWVKLDVAPTRIEYERLDNGDVAILSILVNGFWCDPENFVDPDTLQTWRDDLWQEAQEAA